MRTFGVQVQFLCVCFWVGADVGAAVGPHIFPQSPSMLISDGKLVIKKCHVHSSAPPPRVIFHLPHNRPPLPPREQSPREGPRLPCNGTDCTQTLGCTETQWQIRPSVKAEERHPGVPTAVNVMQFIL